MSIYESEARINNHTEVIDLVHDYYRQTMSKRIGLQILLTIYIMFHFFYDMPIAASNATNHI